MKKHYFAIVLAVCLIAACAGRDEQKVGSKNDPLKLAFMPSPERTFKDDGIKIIENELKKESGLFIDGIRSDNFISIIEGMSDRKIDVAFLNSLGYILAHDFGEATAFLQFKGEDGQMFYRSALIARTGSDIKQLSDLNGKVVAFTNPYSMSGYLMPLADLMKNNIVPKEKIFLNDYEAVVDAVYNGTVDAGAIYYAEHDPDGRIHDARVKLVDKYKDMVDKVSVIYKSGPIPTTPIVYRKGLSEELIKKISAAFESASHKPDFIAALNMLYGATGFVPADEKNFEPVRQVLKELNKDIKEVVPGAVNYYKKHMWDTVPDR